jgi:hypothetical protein
MELLMIYMVNTAANWLYDWLFTYRRSIVGHYIRLHAAYYFKETRCRPGGFVCAVVATLVDVTGLIIYFSAAYLFLSGLLL